MAAAPPPAPPAFAPPEGLPNDIRALLAGRGIDLSADGAEVEWYLPVVAGEGLGTAVRVGNPLLESSLDTVP
jgi:hypothetical protein